MIEALRAHVDSVLAGPEAREAIHRRIEEFAAEGGIALGPDDRTGYADLAEGYVRAVVDLLAACDAAATGAGLLDFAGPILRTAAGYLLSPEDHIPDRQGLYGLVDDAYVACRFVARISDVVAATHGAPLLETSLDQHSPVIRVLIGEPLAGRLDAEIEQGVASALAAVAVARPLPVGPGGWDEWARREDTINAEAEIMAIASGGR